MCEIFGQLITMKQNRGIMHLSESHFKLLVWVGVGTGTAMDTDKWQRQKLGDKHRQSRTGNSVVSHTKSNLYVANEHQGYTAAIWEPSTTLASVEYSHSGALSQSKQITPQESNKSSSSTSAMKIHCFLTTMH